MQTNPPPHKPALNATLRGVITLIGAMLLLPFLDVVAKYLGQAGVPVLMIVWARMVFGVALTLPFVVAQARVGALVPARPLWHLARAGFLIAATFLFFWSLKTMAIADALAIFFVQPLVVTALSPLVLGERVGRARWIAVAVGFVGTLIILRPGFSAFGTGAALAFGAGVSLALYMLITRRMSRQMTGQMTGQDNPLLTTFHTSLMGVLATSVAVVFVWQTPTLWQWGQFLLVGAIATVGHLLITRAYALAEASLLAPLAYTEIVMATLAGWWFFGDLPDGFTWLGLAILIGSAIRLSSVAHRDGARTDPPAADVVGPEGLEPPTKAL